MIDFNFSIRNPFSNRFDTTFYKDGLLKGETKAWEVQCMKDSSIIEVGCSLSFRGDHAGISLRLGLLGRSIHVGLHDTRHWNHEENRWYVYDSAGKAS